ncbi:hypothetical protein PsYK624_007010 [Phanerochaete sordida]|uniref:Uncharacterized protein n=1 Tax=Phanerochaete sordida TaxID=48140 RepID=A0A9P3L776_9APHY|nr:hypothetical protein PsYK624_007010 [Phanerochaete sordida]
MLSSTLRTAARRSCASRRHVSTKMTAKSSKLASVAVPAPTALPEAKQRALIALYHQAETFITPENLEAEIDEEFIYRPLRHPGGLEREVLLRDLRSDLASRRMLPKVGDGKASMMHSRTQAQAADSYAWSGQKAPRDIRVMNALLGLEDVHKPGLEILEEEEERIQEHIRRDKKQSKRQK